MLTVPEGESFGIGCSTVTGVVSTSGGSSSFGGGASVLCSGLFPTHPRAHVSHSVSTVDPAETERVTVVFVSKVVSVDSAETFTDHAPGILIIPGLSAIPGLVQSP